MARQDEGHGARGSDPWVLARVDEVEGLGDSVLGADHEVVQLSPSPLQSTLAFACQDGVIYSLGALGARVTIRGAHSPELVTLGLGLVIPPGCRHWWRERKTGDTGLFLPGDAQDALYPPGSIYLAATLPMEALEARAAERGLVLDPAATGTGFHPHSLPDPLLEPLRHCAESILAGAGLPSPSPARFGYRALDVMIRHFARAPRHTLHRSDLRGHTRIVREARTYIRAHLNRPISVDDLARAARTSRRTLQRAFRRVLDETPVTYIRKLRLHRIRQDLASDEEVLRSVSRAGIRWGIHQPGRLAGWYKDLFGELPSDTVKSRASAARRRVAEVVRAKLGVREGDLARSE